MRRSAQQTEATDRRICGLPFLIGFLVWAVWGHMATAQETVEQIRLRNRHVSEILPAARPLVSPNGFISADQRSNSLIVVDNPAAIARIRKLVHKLDQAVPHLKIIVRYENANAAEEREARAAAAVETDRTRVAIGDDRGKEEGLDTEISEDRRQGQRQSEYMIRVRSGSTAYIEAGYDVPQRERWQDLSRRYGHIPERVVFRRVASGYDIRPVLLDDQVRIEILPRISYFDDRGRNQKIHFTQAATTIFAPLGEWVDIGGVMGGKREVNRQILADSQHAAGQDLTMRLKVTID
jgi:hypothetical protein